MMMKASREITKLCESWWGRMADKHGQKPVFKICLAMKPIIVLAFLFVTPMIGVVGPIVPSVDHSGAAREPGSARPSGATRTGAAVP